jgi:hypothetical protein
VGPLKLRAAASRRKRSRYPAWSSNGTRSAGINEALGWQDAGSWAARNSLVRINSATASQA